MKKLLTLVAPLALLASALPAQAATVIFRASGTVAAGAVDGQSLFGGGALSGLPYETLLRFDTTVPGSTFTSTPTQSVLFGGFDFSGAIESSPLIGGFLRIGNQSLSFDGLFHSTDISAARQSRDEVVQINLIGGLTVYQFSFGAPQFLTNGPNFNPLTFNPTDFPINVVRFVDSFQSSNPTSFRLLTTSAGFVALSAVPEPATWTFMIFGFGLIGCSMRRTRTGRQIVSA